MEYSFSTTSFRALKGNMDVSSVFSDGTCVIPNVSIITTFGLQCFSASRNEKYVSFMLSPGEAKIKLLTPSVVDKAAGSIP